MVEKLLEEIEIIGIKQTTKALAQDRVKILFIAEDADKHLVQHMEQTAKEKDVEVVYIESMKKLGNACKIDVGAAVAAILK